MGLKKKIPKDGYFEQDPFLGPLPLTNNNGGQSMAQACCDEKHKLKCSGKSHQLCTFNTIFCSLEIDISGILLPNTVSRIISSLRRISSASLSLVLGVSLIMLGFICFIISPQIESALTQLIQTWTALSGGKNCHNFH